MAKRNDETAVNKVVIEYIDQEKKIEELKSCPFCGGRASFSVRNNPYGSVDYAKCECNDCHAVIGVGRLEIVELIKELCIAKWNRRVNDDAEKE